MQSADTPLTRFCETRSACSDAVSLGLDGVGREPVIVAKDGPTSDEPISVDRAPQLGWGSTFSAVKLNIALLLIVAALGWGAATAETASARYAVTVGDVEMRDQLVVDQEALLNVYCE